MTPPGSFKGESSQVRELANPFSLPFDYKPFHVPPIQLLHRDEIRFLDAMQVGETVQETLQGNELAFALSRLLNSYGILGLWFTGSMSKLSTAGFTLVYLGDSSRVPSGFVVEPSPLVAIIYINCIDVRGHLCLRL